MPAPLQKSSEIYTNNMEHKSSSYLARAIHTCDHLHSQIRSAQICNWQPGSLLKTHLETLPPKTPEIH